MADPDYSFLERVLHRLALQYRPIADFSFDLDQSMVRGADPAAIVQERHVFVSGLARAGTTLLMRRFHATGRYRSLTYRDMPFVLAPNLWQKISATSRRDIQSAERAHGDNLLVDADSPESLDEVFWRIFTGKEYIHADRLTPHAPDAEIVEKFRHYVNAILAASQPRLTRYLSKNNNNILRLGTIQKAFPRALILIPFREPVQHAHSLLRQHVRFSKMQAERTFTLQYMTWLGHHEFGLDHRPFQFGTGGGKSSWPVSSLDYWLHEWCETYAWLERTKPPVARFVCYEDLCTREDTWAQLARLADVPATGEGADELKLSRQAVPETPDPALAERAAGIYARLVAQGRAELS